MGFGVAAQPQIDGGDVEGAGVDVEPFVGAQRHRAGAFELVDHALDAVERLVRLCVEDRWAPTGPASVGAVAGLVVLDRDGRSDATDAQVGADARRGIRLVAQHPVGPGARAPRPSACQSKAGHDRGEAARIGSLPGAGQGHQRAAPQVGRDVDLGGQTPARSSQPFTGEVDLHQRPSCGAPGALIAVHPPMTCHHRCAGQVRQALVLVGPGSATASRAPQRPALEAARRLRPRVGCGAHQRRQRGCAPRWSPR